MEKFIEILKSLATSKIGIASLVAGAIAIVLALIATSCSPMYELNRIVRYEYQLSRDSDVKTQTQLTVTNKQD